MSFHIAVRSYGRSDQILKKTLGELQKQTGLDLGNQLVLAVTDQEYDLYRRELNHPLRGEFPIKDIIKVPLGGFQATNGLVDYFKDGDQVIFMDDDIGSIKGYRDIADKDSRYDITDLDRYFTYAFDKFKDVPFGFDFTPNLMFKQGKPFAELKPRKIGGAWWGAVIDKPLLKTAQSHEDDNIRTARALSKHHCVGSINWLVATTAVGTNKGGMQSSGDRAEAEMRSLKTKWACEHALHSPEVAKYFQNEPVFIDSMNFFSLRLRNIRDLRKIDVNHKEIQWSTYFQDAPDTTVSLEDLF